MVYTMCAREQRTPHRGLNTAYLMWVRHGEGDWPDRPVDEAKSDEEQKGAIPWHGSTRTLQSSIHGEGAEEMEQDELRLKVKPCWRTRMAMNHRNLWGDGDGTRTTTPD